MKLTDVCIKDRGDGWSLWWVCDGDTAEAIGDLDDTQCVGMAYRDIIIAERIAAQSPGATRNAPHEAWVWPDRKAAAAVRQAIVAAVNAKKAETPLPDWAQKALAAGWKAPKGWKP